MAIKLMIDSASDIGFEEAQAMGVIMVPMEIRFDNEEFLDGVNLTPNEFYVKLAGHNDLPKTSQINPFRWEEEFAKVTSNGDELIVITISSKLSGTYNSAIEAASKFDGKVCVIDSLNACIGERLLGLYALNLIKEEKSLEEIAENLNQAKLNIKVIAMVDTLKYLKKGGRISSMTAIAGELFSIKPIIGVVDGEVKMLSKAVGAKKAYQLLTSLVQKTNGIDFSKPYGAIWSGTDDTAISKYLESSSAIWEDSLPNVTPYQMGSTIGTHVGPGAVGIAFFQK